ncbi:hypothetical protein DIS07_11585 [Polaribacter aquimarinus]|uniref:Uncharacterized protein n=1 Tax=Polaribacter aquimarinus TaxID=2100726 RepID=A0A2U2J8A6_9FLAO|nr:hypothetical protein DIS07_11585 [Polaribacter aquimarinus]
MFENGGAFGFGYIILPFTLFPNLFLISSITVLRKKDFKNPVLLLINTLGLTYCLFFFWFFIISTI